jgi:hypothetical protein
MKKIIALISLLTLILFSKTIFAQTIHTTVAWINVGCNHSTLGTAFVNVTNPTNHPPYIYTWSNGAVHSGGTVDSISGVDVGTYTVSITDSQDSEIGTAEVTVQEDFCSMAPESVFTPNGDGYNDKWLIQFSDFFPDADFLVFNRLGQKVWELKGEYIPWEGNSMAGQALPDAGYYYIIYPNKSDKKVIIKGSVSIVH